MIEMITSVHPEFYLYAKVKQQIADIEMLLKIVKQQLKDIESGKVKANKISAQAQ